MADTIRLTNLKYVVGLLQAMDLTGMNDRDSITAATPTRWSTLVLGPIANLENRQRYACGVVVGDEVTQTQFPNDLNQLPVTIEFKMTWNTGDQLPAEEAERLLGLIKGTLAQDPSLGGTAIDFRSTGNSISLDLFADKMIVGAVHFHMEYRNNTKDPTLVV